MSWWHTVGIAVESAPYLPNHEPVPLACQFNMLFAHPRAILSGFRYLFGPAVKAQSITHKATQNEY